MANIPDAPSIRDRERNGVPDANFPCCPICGEPCETYYFDKFGDVVGCEECIHTGSSCEYEDDCSCF